MNSVVCAAITTQLSAGEVMTDLKCNRVPFIPERQCVFAFQTVDLIDS